MPSIAGQLAIVSALGLGVAEAEVALAEVALGELDAAAALSDVEDEGMPVVELASVAEGTEPPPVDEGMEPSSVVDGGLVSETAVDEVAAAAEPESVSDGADEGLKGAATLVSVELSVAVAVLLVDEKVSLLVGALVEL